MKKMINRTHLQGVLYEHNLEKKVTGPNSKAPNTPYISGTISIATDDDMTNIVTVHYTYVTETTASGKPNNNYSILSDIADGVLKTYMDPTCDAEHATKLTVNSAIGLNEFYTDRNGTEELVSAKRNEGGFITIIKAITEKPEDRNVFDVDMLITGVKHIDANEENDTPEKATVTGAVFNFRNELLPVSFSAVNPGAIAYFEGLEASQTNPVFTRVKGSQISETIVRRYVQESAFGDDAVREVKSSHKDFVITWAAKEPYVWDDEETILATELGDCIKNRELALATLKKQRDDYLTSRNNAAAAPSASAAFNKTATATATRKAFEF